MADMKTLTLGGKTFNFVDVEARAKAIPTVEVGGDTLTWDGNTEGLVQFSPEALFPNKLFRVSETVPPLEALENGYSVVYKGYGTIDCTKDFIRNPDDQGLCYDLVNSTVVIVPSDVNGVGLQKGTYFTSGYDSYVMSLIIPGYTGFGEKKKIDPEYLYQPDWNQNDETAANFIKNRTHYTEEEIKVFLEEVETTHNSALMITLPIPDDRKLIVTFDGVVYNCDIFGDDGSGACKVGDPNLVKYPFYLDSIGGPKPLCMVSCADSATHSIAIGYNTEKVVKIDPKFIPGPTVLYENYDGVPPSTGVIPCDISPYKYVEVLFIRNDGAGDTHSAVAGLLVGKAAAARANIILHDAPGTIRIVQAALLYDTYAQSFMIGENILVSYNTTNNMTCTPSLDKYTFPARIVGYK